MLRLRRAGRWFVSPRTQFVINAVLTVVWAALFIPGLISWRDSVPFLVFVSIYANFVGHLSGMASAMAGRKADADDPT